MRLPISGCLSSMREHADEGHGAGDFAAAGAFEQFLNVVQRGRSERLGADLAAGHVAAQGFAAALVQVLHLRAVVGRTVEGRVRAGFVADGNFEARAEGGDFVFVEFLLLVRNVAAFAGFAEAVAFDGVGEDQRGLALVFERRFVGVVDLLRIVAAAAQLEALLRRDRVRDQIEQSGYLPKKCWRTYAPALMT